MIILDCVEHILGIVKRFVMGESEFDLPLGGKQASLVGKYVYMAIWKFPSRPNFSLFTRSEYNEYQVGAQATTQSEV